MNGLVKNILFPIIILVTYWKGSESYSLIDNIPVPTDNRTLITFERQTQGHSNNGRRCTAPAQPDHGRWVYLNNGSKDAADEQIDANTVIVFSCKQGYQLSTTNDDSFAIFCKQTGEWNVAVMPLCQSAFWKSSENYTLNHNIPPRYDNTTVAKFIKPTAWQPCRRNDSKFQCATTSNCINPELICDGKEDCRDGNDEKLSLCKDFPCLGLKFRCDYGACINRNARCDGKKDCTDNSDEMNCKATNKTNTNCRSDHYQCANGQCINIDGKCNGIVECEDKSDETEQLCFNIFCPENTFKCKYGACVNSDAECNNVEDDIYNSNEEEKRRSAVFIPVINKLRRRDVSKQCKTPAQPANGDLTDPSGKILAVNSRIDVHSAIKYSCHPGYKLSTTIEPSLVVLCEPTGEWGVTELPTCQKLCPSIYSNNLTELTCRNDGSPIRCDKATDNTILTYKCAPYYEPPEGVLRIITCLHGSWDYLPNCIPVCGEKRVSATPLIVNGHDVKRGHYPWVVALYSRKTTDPYFTNICSGSLISTEIVITAAHCVTNKVTGKVSDPKYFRVAAGKYYNEYDDPRDNDTAQYAEIAQIEANEEYKGQIQNFRGDIALLKLKIKLALSEVVQPVCYNKLPTIEPNTVGVIAGWGYTISSGKPSETLKELELPYVAYEQCSKEFDAEFSDRYLTPDKLCAGFKDRNTSVCKGDSGGGIVFSNPNYKGRYFIHGIVSLGHNLLSNQVFHCDIQRSALLTKVDTYMDWIHLKVRQWTINSGAAARQGGEEYSVYVRSGSRCTAPAQPDHGRWVYLNNSSKGAADEQIDANTAITFSCERGYQLSATNEDSLAIFCKQTGEWNVAVMPLCQKLCPSLYNSPLITLSCQNNGLSVPCDKATDNTILRYKCAPYYEPVHGKPESSICYDGLWVYKPDCIPVCGEKRVSAVPLIVGGQDVERGHYPWVVAVYRNKDSDPVFTIICSGNLISTKIVLTAAHCVTGKQNHVKYYRVSAGKYYNRYNDPSDMDTSQYSEVAQIEVSKYYKGELQNFFGDIALLKLQTSMILSNVVQPVCYTNLPNLEENDHGVITGWGYTTTSSQPSETLKELEVSYSPEELCLRNFDKDFASRYFTADKLCAESIDKNAGGCMGDSGVGLVFRNPNYQGRYFIHAVSGLAEIYIKNEKMHCNVHSGMLYTKVSSYMEWIQLTVQEWTN